LISAIVRSAWAEGPCCRSESPTRSVISRQGFLWLTSQEVAYVLGPGRTFLSQAAPVDDGFAPPNDLSGRTALGRKPRSRSTTSLSHRAPVNLRRPLPGGGLIDDHRRQRQRRPSEKAGQVRGVAVRRAPTDQRMPPKVIGPASGDADAGDLGRRDGRRHCLGDRDGLRPRLHAGRARGVAWRGTLSGDVLRIGLPGMASTASTSLVISIGSALAGDRRPGAAGRGRRRQRAGAAPGRRAGLGVRGADGDRLRAGQRHGNCRRGMVRARAVAGVGKAGRLISDDRSSETPCRCFHRARRSRS
jgi:hypothetical protein